VAIARMQALFDCETHASAAVGLNSAFNDFAAA